MSSLDTQDLFGSGPCSFVPGSWERQIDWRGFAGLDGLVGIDMGLRSRRIVQQGRLQADTIQLLHQQISTIESMLDGKIHSLVDNRDQSYPRVVLEHFEQTSPIQTGRGFWCEYVIHYLQLP